MTSEEFNKRVQNLIESTKQLIIISHKRIIEVSGGEQGIRDDGGIYLSAYKIMTYNLTHVDPVGVGALAYSEFARKHHFMDGNKRTAHVVARIFMMMDDYDVQLKYKEALPFILRIAQYESKVTSAEIKDWLKNNCKQIQDKDRNDALKSLYDELRIDEEHEKHQN